MLASWPHTARQPSNTCRDERIDSLSMTACCGACNMYVLLYVYELYRFGGCRKGACSTSRFLAIFRLLPGIRLYFI